MGEKRKLMGLFAAVGFVGALGATIFQWFFVGPDNTDVVLGIHDPWLLAAFPFLGALLSALWSACFRTVSFGASQGALVAFLAFLSFCALVGSAGPAGVWGFVAFAFFGFILFGWFLVVLGAVAGRYFRGMISHGAL